MDPLVNAPRPESGKPTAVAAHSQQRRWAVTPFSIRKRCTLQFPAVYPHHLTVPRGSKLLITKWTLPFLVVYNEQRRTNVDQGFLPVPVAVYGR